MRLFWLAIPKPLETAVGACNSHFAQAAGLGALVILCLAPTITMMQVYDRVVPTGGVRTLMWITVIVGLTLLTALNEMPMRVGMGYQQRLTGEAGPLPVCRGRTLKLARTPKAARP